MRDFRNCSALAVLLSRSAPHRTRSFSNVHRTFSTRCGPFGFESLLTSARKKNLPFRRDFLARHEGLSQLLRTCRPSVSLRSPSDTQLLECPQDILNTLRPFRVRVPSYFCAQKKSPLSERFSGAP